MELSVMYTEKEFDIIKSNIKGGGISRYLHSRLSAHLAECECSSDDKNERITLRVHVDTQFKEQLTCRANTLGLSCAAYVQKLFLDPLLEASKVSGKVIAPGEFKK